MSASLKWEIIPEEPESNDVGFLTQIFKHRYELGSEEHSVILTESDIPFLEGIVFAGDKNTAADAKALITAIENNERIKVYLQY